MPTIIDSLVVKLGWDEKDLEAQVPGIKKALSDVEKESDKVTAAQKRSQKQSQELAKQTKANTQEFKNLTGSLGKFLAVIGGTVAVKAIISDFIETNAQLDRLSKNLGLSVSTISAWSNATEKLGGSAQGLQGTLDMLSRSQTQLMLTGESSLIPYFSALGISLADVHGKARPVTDLLLDLSDKLSHLDRTEANNLGRMMGLDQGTLNLLLQGRKELELEIRRQKEQNAVTAAQAAEASKLQKAIVGVKQSFAAFGRTLLMDAAPIIEKVLGTLQNFADWAQRNKETIGDFLKVITAGMAALALASLPIDLTAAAVVALAAAVVLLYQDYQTWKRGGDSLIDWGKWEPGIDAATAGIRGLRDVIVGLYDAARDLKNFLGNNPLIGKALAAASPALAALGFVGSTINDGSKNAHPVQQGTATVQGGGFGGGAGSPSADYIKKYFQSQGWSAAQAAGIAANLMSESGGKINATGDNGSAFGIAQWHSDRQAAFAAWAGHDIRSSTLAEQLAFVQYELTHGGETSAGNALRKQTTGAGAGSSVSENYERPKDSAGEASRRGAYAQSLLGMPGASAFAGNAPQGSGAAATTTVDKSVETHIGEINIQTKATDAQGIASDMEHALDYLFIAQANYGLT